MPKARSSARTTTARSRTTSSSRCRSTRGLPSSKAGSVAHFQAEVLEENLLRAVAGKSPLPDFDGHANCFIESGKGKALLIDFNYETEPLPGMFPFTVLGPMPLLKEARRNHWGKLAFKWAYWN